MLGLNKSDQVRIKKAFTFAIKRILGREAPFWEHEEPKLRRAVSYIEERDPRLAVCESGWGTCSLLSRALGNLRPRGVRRGTAAASTGEAGTEAGDGDGDGDDAETRDADTPPAQRREGGQLAQLQLDFLSQL